MKVHNTLGSGFQEVIYQRCLAIELELTGLGFEREKEQIIFYNTIEVGSRRADFVVENEIIVELKALITLEDIHLEAVLKPIQAGKDKNRGLLKLPLAAKKRPSLSLCLL